MESIPMLVEYTLRSTAVCLIAALALLLLRKSAATYRHLVCLLGFVVLLTLPLLRDLLPPIPLPQGLVLEPTPPAPAVPPSIDRIAPIAIPPPVPPVLAEPPPIAPPPPAAPPVTPSPVIALPVLPTLWLAGVMFLLARLAIALLRLAKWKSGSRIASPEQTAWLASLAREQRIATPLEFRIGPADTAPVTWGVRRPVILLPEPLASHNAAGESAARHELAHIARRDWLWQMLAEIVCALYWFHPGVWWLRHRLRAESERACDDAVLLAGVSAADYASHLLTIARQCRRPGTPWVAPLAMARPLGLELRLRSILNDRLPRQSTPLRCFGIIALVAPFLGVSALQGARASKAPVPVSPPALPALVSPPSPVSPPAPVSPVAPVSPLSRVPHAPLAPPAPAKPLESWTDSLQRFLVSSLGSFSNAPVTPQPIPAKAQETTSPKTVQPPSDARKGETPMSQQDAVPIAWGKARNGLQLGIRLPDGVAAFSSLKVAQFDVVIRNTSPRATVFGWWGYPSIEQFSPDIFTAEGKKVAFIKLLAGPYLKHSTRLEAGEQKTLGTLRMPFTVIAGRYHQDEFAEYQGQFRARFDLSVDFGDGKGELPGRDELLTGDLTFPVIRVQEKPVVPTVESTKAAPVQTLSLTPTEGVRFPLQSDAVRWQGYDYHLLTISKPTFQIDPKTQHLTAVSEGGIVCFDDVTYTVHAEIYNATGRTLGTALMKVPIQRVWLGKVVSTTGKILLDFGPVAKLAGAARYTLTLSHERVLTPNEWGKDAYEQAKIHLTRIREARKENDQQALWNLLIDRKFDEAVTIAAERGDEALIAELIQQSWFGGPQAGGNGVTWTAYYPTDKPVAALLKRGVRADVANASGDTGLHLTYREEIARLLLNAGAKLNARNNSGQTPLIAQAYKGNLWTGRGILPLLLERGADVNATDNEGMTALMHAAKQGMVDDVKALLQHGADRQRRDKKGKTARDYASPWAWQMAPGFLTKERLQELEAQANRDQYRIAELLEGNPDPGDRSPGNSL